MAVMRISCGLLTAVRFETTSSINGSPHLPNQNPPSRPLLSVSKPSFIVRTESNVRLEQRRKPDPPCVICAGSGRVDCNHCCGRGRTNLVHLAMLPKGEWPKWCRACGGSGLGYCSRCLGTGEYRYIMGFHFMKRDTDQNQDNGKYLLPDGTGPKTAADLFLNNDKSNPDDDSLR